VLRVLQNATDVSPFDDTSCVHHVDVVGDSRDDSEVMRDHHDRHPQVSSQLYQEVDDLCLNRDIQRACRLVRDE